MGAILLLTCTATLIIVVYIVYFKQKQINVYPYPPSYYPKFPNIFYAQSSRKEFIPPSGSKYSYWNYSNRKMYYKKEDNYKSPSNNFDYSIKAKLIKSPGFLLNKYRNDTALKDNHLNENKNYTNIPKMENFNMQYDTKMNNVDLNSNNKNYRIINAGDFLSQSNKYSSLNSTNNKKIILNTPITCVFKSLFKNTGSSYYEESMNQNKERTIIKSILKKNKAETRNIIKKLEFNEAFTSGKKKV